MNCLLNDEYDLWSDKRVLHYTALIVNSSTVCTFWMVSTRNQGMSELLTPDIVKMKKHNYYLINNHNQFMKWQ